MRNKVNISVGIPAFNEEANIKRLINILLAQKAASYRLREIIVVSDNSSDKTVAQVKSIADPRVRLIIGKKRLGQNVRQNQIMKEMSNKSHYLLMIEADTLPSDRYYIEHLVQAIPKSRKFSMVVGTAVPVEHTNYMSKVVNFGFSLRFHIFEEAGQKPNVYLFAENGLLSREFMTNLTWDKNYNEDSYCFRQALRSGLPIIRTTKAKKYFKSVETLHDYFLQSGKFQKARAKEKQISNIFSIQLQKRKTVKIILANVLRHPDLAICYFAILCFSRVYSSIQPNYSPLWNSYLSTKNPGGSLS